MKAVTFRDKRTVAVEDVVEPRIESPGDVVVRNELTAICGSDLHVYHQRETGIEPGTVMGHEFLGRVAEVGGDVRSFKEGDRVVAPFTTNCGHCFYCQQGLTCRCSQGQLFGWVEKGAGLQGAQAEYVRVPLADTTLFQIPEDIDSDEALLLGDILATGFFCAELAMVRPDGLYAVIGCGPVGILSIVGARELGAGTVLALDKIPERLGLAEQFGAVPVDVRKDDPIDVVQGRTEGRGADAVLEVVGSPAATRLAVDLVRPGGVIAAVGVHTESQFAFSPVEAYDKNITYRAGRCPARHYMDRLLPLVRSGRYDLQTIISHRLPLVDGVRAYQIFDEKLERCTKVVMRP